MRIKRGFRMRIPQMRIKRGLRLQIAFADSANEDKTRIPQMRIKRGIRNWG